MTCIEIRGELFNLDHIINVHIGQYHECEAHVVLVTSDGKTREFGFRSTDDAKELYNEIRKKMI